MTFTSRKKTTLALAGAVSAIFGCGNRPLPNKPQAAAPTDAVARIGDHVVTVADMSDQLKKQPAALRSAYATKEKKLEYLNNLVRFELLASEAARRGFDKDPEVLRIMKQQMISKYLERDHEPKVSANAVADADVAKYYEEHKTEFVRPEDVRATELVIKDERKAKLVAREVAAAVKKSENKFTPFREAILKHSDDPTSKMKGGDLAFFERTAVHLPRPVVDASFALKEPGTVSPPVKTDRGFVILQLIERRTGTQKSLEEARPELQRRLAATRRLKAMDELLAEIKTKTRVEIFDQNLDKVSLVQQESGAAGTSTKVASGNGR